MATFVLPVALALQPHPLHIFLLAQDYQQRVGSATVAVVVAAVIIAAAAAAADAAVAAADADNLEQRENHAKQGKTLGRNMTT